MREAFNGCEIAIEQLYGNNVLLGDVYSDDEIDYMKFRCKWIASSVSRFIDSIAFKAAMSIDVTSKDYDIKLVRPRIRRLFPMTEESGLAFDLYIKENKIAADE